MAEIIGGNPLVMYKTALTSATNSEKTLMKTFQRVVLTEFW